ncbi:MAG: OB-fold nucleic acid binding domain-containing protein [Candidatus Dojkabacteria bacterium]|nr:OB-fold nucleic acid binding domain-containing protein [Candidatus Dojkabacteria bacterium]
MENHLTSEDKKVSIKDLSKHVDSKIEIEGWVYNRRGSGKISFVQFRDGSGFTQVIFEEDKVESDIWEVIGTLSPETSVKVVGTVSKHPKKDEYEIQGESIVVLSISEEYPIGNKDHGVEFLFKNRDLYLRSKTPWASLRIRDQVFRSVTNFFSLKKDLLELILQCFNQLVVKIQLSYLK